LLSKWRSMTANLIKSKDLIINEIDESNFSSPNTAINTISIVLSFLHENLKDWLISKMSLSFIWTTHSGICWAPLQETYSLLIECTTIFIYPNFNISMATSTSISTSTAQPPAFSIVAPFCLECTPSWDRANAKEQQSLFYELQKYVLKLSLWLGWERLWVGLLKRGYINSQNE